MIRFMQSTAPFLLLEVKMILRNKKSLHNLYQIILMYIFMIFLLFHANHSISDNFLGKVLIINMMSCLFMLAHGIYLLTWESTYFSFLITRKVSFHSFFKAKYSLFALSATFLSLINIPILIFVKESLLMYFSFLIFNIGITALLVVSVSLFNNERASLDRGIFINYEGYGFWQYLVFIVEFLLPAFIYISISKIWSPDAAMIILIISGTIGIFIISYSPALFFLKRKYKIINGFNKK